MRLLNDWYGHYSIENSSGETVAEVLLIDNTFILYAFGERRGEVESFDEAVQTVKDLEWKLFAEKYELETTLNEIEYDLKYYPMSEPTKFILIDKLAHVKNQIEELENKLGGEFE